MAVTVYFKNGGSVTITRGTQVEGGHFPAYPGATSSDRAIVVKDRDDKEIGHFVTTELVGYFVHEGARGVV